MFVHSTFNVAMKCRDQVLDALAAVGVPMKPSLAETLMKCCGSDAQGRVKIADLRRML